MGTIYLSAQILNGGSSYSPSANTGRSSITISNSAQRLRTIGGRCERGIEKSAPARRGVLEQSTPAMAAVRGEEPLSTLEQLLWASSYPLHKEISSAYQLSLLQRFLKKARAGKRTRCLIWTASTNRKGYGRFRVRSRKDTISSSILSDLRLPEVMLAHRASYLLFKGPFDPELTVDHIRGVCGRRDCVNPEHLRLMSHVENSTEGSLYRHGGGVFGEGLIDDDEF